MPARYRYVRIVSRTLTLPWRFQPRNWVARFMHRNHGQLVKLYHDGENRWASQILSKHEVEIHSDTLTSLGVINSRNEIAAKADGASAHDVARRFAVLSGKVSGKEMSIEDTPTGDLCEELCRAMSDMTDEDLVGTLRWLCVWKPPQSTRTPKYQSIWNCLDWECHKRCDEWPLDLLLNVGRMFFVLRLSRITLFNKKMIRLLCRDISKLEYRHLIQLLFYVNLQREVEGSVMRNVESKLLSYSGSVTADDMAVAAMAFFKTRTPASSSEFILMGVKKLEECLKDGSNITIAALAKFLKKSANRNFVKTYGICQEICVPFVASFNPTTATHVAMMTTPLTFCNSTLLRTITENFPKDLVDVRLKELTKLVFCLATYAPRESYCAGFCDAVIKELLKQERGEEILLYPENLVSLSLYLAYMDKYCVEFIKRVFDAGYVRRLEEKQGYKFHRELYVLSRSVAVDRPDWKINDLPEDFEPKMMKVHGRTYNVDSLFSNVIDEIGAMLNSLFGGKFCKKQRILPHYVLPDLLFSTECGKPVVFRELRSDIMKNLKPDGKRQWYAVVYGGQHFYAKDTRKPLGNSLMKMRHLRNVGCKVIEVPGFKFLTLKREEKLPFIRKIIGHHGILNLK